MMKRSHTVVVVVDYSNNVIFFIIYLFNDTVIAVNSLLLFSLHKDEDQELELLLVLLVMTVASDFTSVLVAAEVGVGARTTKV